MSFAKNAIFKNPVGRNYTPDRVNCALRGVPAGRPDSSPVNLVFTGLPSQGTLTLSPALALPATPLLFAPRIILTGGFPTWFYISISTSTDRFAKSRRSFLSVQQGGDNAKPDIPDQYRQPEGRRVSGFCSCLPDRGAYLQQAGQGGQIRRKNSF